MSVFKKLPLLLGLLFAFSSNAIAAGNPAEETAAKTNSKLFKNKEARKDASEQVADSIKVIQKMESEKDLKGILSQAHGLFIVPSYGRAALGVGARGGEGILLLKQNGNWRDPAFYNFGGLSAGLEAGAEGGPIAFILNNEKAAQRFMKNQNFSLNADAGLTIVDWSAKGQAELTKADLIAWSDTKGLFGGAAINVKDIMFDKDDTTAFYGKSVTLNDIFNGKAKAPEQKVSSLRKALPAQSGQLSGGSTDEDKND